MPKQLSFLEPPDDFGMDELSLSLEFRDRGINQAINHSEQVEEGLNCNIASLTPSFDPPSTGQFSTVLPSPFGPVTKFLPS